MSPQMTRMLISAVVLFHGIGHAVGVLTTAGLVERNEWHGRSWLLAGVLGERFSRAIGVVLWAIGLVGFLAIGAGMLGWPATQGIWRSLIIILASISLVTLGLFWHALPAIFNKVGAIAINAAALIGILLANWPPPDLIP